MLHSNRHTGQDLHAPLVERLIELPMDISGGRINGDLRLRAYDSKTWHFPSFGGRLRCVSSVCIHTNAILRASQL